MKKVVTYRPIGFIHTPFRDIAGMPIQPAAARGVAGRVVVDEAYREGLKDIEGFSQLELKRCHTLRVAENAGFIAAALSFPESEQRLAEGVGLVHDVGRFTQLAQHGSFRDADTVDHGAEGRRVLEAQDLSFLPDPGDRERLLCVVEYQNRKRTDIPSGLSPERDRFLRLIRDADKLDIMELVLRAVASDGFQDLPGMLPHIRLCRELSPGVLTEAAKTRSVSNGNLSTLADFLVMMATWCYDMNYPPTRRLTVQRDILPRIRRELPDTKDVRELFAGITEAMLKTEREKKTWLTIYSCSWPACWLVDWEDFWVLAVASC